MRGQRGGPVGQGRGEAAEPVEEDLERRAEGQTAPTAAADVVDPTQLLIDGVELPELRLPDVEGHARAAFHARRGGPDSTAPRVGGIRWLRRGPCRRSA